MIERVGNCCKCGQSAAWNTPFIDGCNNLYCNRCAYESKELLAGIEQHLTEAGKYQPHKQWHEYAKNHCCVWCVPDTGEIRDAWSDCGRRVFWVHKEEREMQPAQFLDMMIALRAAKRFRCSRCGIEIAESEVGGYPLFAGVNCPECWQKHQAEVEKERRTGAVCSMCGQPYLLCCC